MTCVCYVLPAPMHASIYRFTSPSLASRADISSSLLRICCTCTTAKCRLLVLAIQHPVYIAETSKLACAWALGCGYLPLLPTIAASMPHAIYCNVWHKPYKPKQNQTQARKERVKSIGSFTSGTSTEGTFKHDGGRTPVPSPCYRSDPSVAILHVCRGAWMHA